MSSGLKKNKTILLVEDDAIISMNESKVIGRFGYNVITALSGEDAVRIALGDPEISLVLMDINLGAGIDGTEAARRILAGRTLPIVFLTSHSEKDYVDKVKEITRYGYVIKNSGNFVLQTSIEMAFELFEAHSEIQQREQHYREMVEAAPYGIATHSEGIISYVNPAGMKIIGYPSLDDAIGEHLLERIHPDSRAEVIRRMKEQANGAREVPVLEEKILRKNGETRYAEVSAIRSSFMGKTSVMTFFNDITERKEAEKKAEGAHLRLEIEQRFSQMLLDTTPAYIVAIDFNGKTVMMNRALLDALEYTAEEVRGTDYLSTFVPPDDRDAVRNIFSEIIQEGYHSFNENRIVSKSGVIRLVEWHGKTVVGDRGEGNFFIGAGIDITERDEKEKEAFDWKDRYKLIVEASGLVAYDYNTSTGEILWGSNMEKVLGYSSAEYDGGMEQWIDWLHPDDRDSTLTQLKKAEDDCAYWDTHYRLRHKNGSHVWVRDRGFFIPNDRGKAARQLGVLEDVTDRKKAEEEIRNKNEQLAQLNRELNETIAKLEETNEKLSAISNVFEMANEEFIETNVKLQRAENELRSSEAKLRSMLTNITDVIAIVDAKGIITYKSDNIEKIFGWKPEELVGLNYRDTAHPDDYDRVRKEFKRIMKEQNASTEVEYRYKHKDGSCRMIHLTAMNLIHDPVINGVLVNYHDITGQKQAEEKIQNLLAEKELLLKEVHHRIKNNMSTMISLLSLQSEAVRDTPAETVLRDAGSRIQSMMVLYDRLYRSENLTEMSIRDYLPPLVDEIVRLYPHRIKIKTKKNIDDFTLGVKQLSCIGIMVNELLTNAMKHAFKGRNEGLISISASKKNGSVTIVFEDNGNGIPESVDFGLSTGLGLQIVGILAKQIGGTIRIDRTSSTRFITEFEVLQTQS